MEIGLAVARWLAIRDSDLQEITNLVLIACDGLRNFCLSVQWASVAYSTHFYVNICHLFIDVFGKYSIRGPHNAVPSNPPCCEWIDFIFPSSLPFRNSVRRMVLDFPCGSQLML